MRSAARSSCCSRSRPMRTARLRARPCRRRPSIPDAPPSAILLLSDGAQTRGTLAPLEGAARAKSYGIPVFTIALGTPGGTLDFGGVSRPVPPDPVTLRQIAETTGGEFFATQTDARLNAVYEDLASRLGKTDEWRELSFVLVGLAALFALAAGALSRALDAAPPVKLAPLITVAALALVVAGCGDSDEDRDDRADGRAHHAAAAAPATGAARHEHGRRRREGAARRRQRQDDRLRRRRGRGLRRRDRQGRRDRHELPRRSGRAQRDRLVQRRAPRAAGQGHGRRHGGRARPRDPARRS